MSTAPPRDPAWSEVVTVALLGTDRRPLPPEVLTASAADGEAPASAVLLDHAVRQRARHRAARPLGRCPAPPQAPDDPAPWASAAAQELLTRLLARPVPELLNAWLGAAAARGVRPAPEHWTELAAFAATRPDLDRGVLAQALGAQGVWFVRQNPAWSRLAEVLERPVPGRPADPPVGVPDEAAVRARPELALDVPAPWPRELAVAALRVLLAGQLGWRASRYGAAVGARLATADADLLQQAADALPDGPQRGLPGLRLVQEAVAAAAAAAADRAAVDQAFDLDALPGDPTDAPEHQEQP
ncbi:hypothetical protein SAMN04488543_2587 [Friedmanniella luteola]|uniref:Uncharacterized protein n=1 Tax=Friedmanniella luteola TaxID=546871 RepID=A0A1H1VXZ6_9ACTN|nr:hypothetical protein [Friedmanniella luteola]SDS88949.1 hypothetical protein SAMN04488543_2587 [Friedmanniella luteola]